MKQLLIIVVVGCLSLFALGCGDEFKCTKDFDCPATQVCNTQSGQCEPFICDVDGDCDQAGAVCLDNQCNTAAAAK